jgi:hypothetical protein
VHLARGDLLFLSIGHRGPALSVLTSQLWFQGISHYRRPSASIGVCDLGLDAPQSRPRVRVRERISPRRQLGSRNLGDYRLCGGERGVGADHWVARAALWCGAHVRGLGRAPLNKDRPIQSCLSFAENTAKRRIACGLLLRHIVPHALYGNIEGACLTGDQAPGEGDR